MALKTLYGVKQIGGFELVDMDNLKLDYPEMFDKNSGAMKWELFEEKIRPNKFIYVRHEKNSISFTIQSKPISEVGIDGCQVDTIIETAKVIIEGLDLSHPSKDNKEAMYHLGQALKALNNRKKDRVERGVEGTNKK